MKQITIAISLVIIGVIAMGLVTEVNYSKIVNGAGGVEFLVKDTIPFDGFDLKLGASENFTHDRGASPLQLNHCGYKLSIGADWDIGDFKLGYIHQHAGYFDGATNIDVFDNRSRDTIFLRKEL